MTSDTTSAGRRTWLTWLPSWLTLPPADLLRDLAYRRLWLSILISSLGGQVTMLALPLTAAVLLQATPSQMGLLTFMELAPLVGLSDAIVDLVSTGNTLKANNLEAVVHISDVSSRLVVNKAALKLKYEVIQPIIDAFRDARQEA